jgi:hypothetical protein
MSTVGEPTPPGSRSAYTSRRSSYFGGVDQAYSHGRYSQVGGYYGRPRDPYNPRNSYAPRDYYNSRRESYGTPDSQDNYGPPPPRHRYARGMPSDPAMNRHVPYSQPVYPNNSHQQSRETFVTGESSGSQSEPWANSTDPSSENSSIDRFTAAQKYPEAADGPGPSNYGRGSIPEDRATDANQTNPYGQPPPRIQTNGAGYYNVGKRALNFELPSVPPYASNVPSQLSQTPPLTVTSGNAAPPPKSKLQRGESQKRLSWLKKRFGRS